MHFLFLFSDFITVSFFNNAHSFNKNVNLTIRYKHKLPAIGIQQKTAIQSRPRIDRGRKNSDSVTSTSNINVCTIDFSFSTTKLCITCASKSPAADARGLPLPLQYCYCLRLAIYRRSRDQRDQPCSKYIVPLRGIPFSRCTSSYGRYKQTLRS